MKILLVGLPGAGASTVGALLGQRLGWPFLDDDVLIERTGSAAKALTLLLGMPGDLVATVPDEVIEDLRLADADAHIVWLRCSLPVLAQRAVTNGRLGDDAVGALRRLIAERADRYQFLATQIVDTDANPAGAAANLVINAIRP